MKYLLPILSLLLILSCKSDPPPPPPKQKKETPKPEPKPVNPDIEKWANFWGDLTTAIKSDDVEKLANMTRFPLRGIESLLSGKTVTREKFIANYKKIFDKETKAAFEPDKTRFTEFSLTKEKSAAEYHLPLKQKIRGIKVTYKTEETPKPKKKDIAYYFAKENGEYILYAVRIGE